MILYAVSYVHLLVEGVISFSLEAPTTKLFTEREDAISYVKRHVALLLDSEEHARYEMEIDCEMQYHMVYVHKEGITFEYHYAISKESV